MAEKGKKLEIDCKELREIDTYEKKEENGPGGTTRWTHDSVFGLDVPERVFREVYIVRPDVTPAVGWETGRESEPAFLDMNLHALRDRNSNPSVVLFQFDKKDPMNPLGLLMAYAEAQVKPVVSDFDTFLVGSRGVQYEPTPPEQVTLMNWLG